MSLAVKSSAASVPTPQTRQHRCGTGSGGSGRTMLRALCLRSSSRLLGRAAAFSSSLLTPHASVREASTRTAVAVAARAARTEAAPVGDAAGEAKVKEGANCWGWGSSRHPSQFEGYRPPCSNCSAVLDCIMQPHSRCIAGKCAAASRASPSPVAAT